MTNTKFAVLAIAVVGLVANVSDASARNAVAKTRYYICTHAYDDDGNRRYSNGFCLQWALKKVSKPQAQDQIGFSNRSGFKRHSFEQVKRSKMLPRTGKRHLRR